MTTSLNRTLAAIWFVIVVCYMAYCWYNYAGLYRWLAQWELAAFGKFYVAWTAFLPVIVLVAPAFWLVGDLKGRPARPAVPRNNLRLLRIAGIVALMVAVTAGVLGYRKASQMPTVGVFDLRQSSTPPKADQLIVTGIVRTDLIVGLESEISGSKQLFLYVPLVAPDWKRGDAISYFLKTNQDAYVSPDRKLYRIDRSEAPFVMTTQPALATSNALPGPVMYSYRSNNVPLAATVSVFDQNTSEAFSAYWLITLLGFIIAFVCLLGSLLASIVLRRAGSRSLDRRV